MSAGSLECAKAADLPLTLSVAEAAEVTGLSAYQVRKLVSQHEVSARKVGCTWRITTRSLLERIGVPVEPSRASEPQAAQRGAGGHGGRSRAPARLISEEELLGGLLGRKAAAVRHGRAKGRDQ